MARKEQSEIVTMTNSLKEMVKSGEIFNYTEKDLEIKLNTTRKTVRKHLKIIKEELGNRDMQIITLRLVDVLDEIMKDIELYWKKAKTAKDEQKTIYYGKQMMFYIDKFIDYLERLGIKQKIADKVDLTADINHKQIIVNVNMPNGTIKNRD